ncbi:alcohol dehydrogenase catalytic domain-containing protein [Rhodococcus sp. NPDC003383]
MTTSQTTYRAAVVRKFGPPDVIRIENLPVGEPPAPGVVRVAVRIGGLNPVDARIRSGAFGGAVPHVPGTEFAGTVVAVGAGVGDYTVGDDVIGFGTPGADAELVDTDPAGSCTSPPHWTGPSQADCRASVRARSRRSRRPMREPVTSWWCTALLVAWGRS